MPDADYFDSQVLHQIDTVRYAAGVSRQVMPLFSPLAEALGSALGRSLGRGRNVALLHAVGLEVAGAVEAAYDETAAVLAGARRDLALLEADAQDAMAQRSYPDVVLRQTDRAGLTLALPDVGINGHTLDEWIEAGKNTSTARVVAAVRRGFEDGASSDEIMRIVRGTATDLGVLGTIKRNVDLLARMSVMQAASEAKGAFSQSNVQSFPFWRFTAILDGKGTRICASLDGAIYRVGEGLRPPRHPGCRSAPIPLRNDSFSNAESYETWLRRQPEAVQVDLLGRERYDMFTQGKITLSDLTNKFGKELTLDQLRARV